MAKVSVREGSNCYLQEYVGALRVFVGMSGSHQSF